jgi:hypothetical protein
MAIRKATPLDADLIARKGKPAPAQIPTPPSPPAASLPHGTKDTVALPVRLDPARYRRLIAYRAQFTPRKTNQEILVEALDAYLDQVED